MPANLRTLLFPYCLDRQPDGRYVALNRKYKPVGFTLGGDDFIDYAAYPVQLTIKGLTPTVAAKLSWDGSANLARIYLYNDGCIPTDSADNWTAYAARLRVLLGLKTAEG